MSSEIIDKINAAIEPKGGMNVLFFPGPIHVVQALTQKYRFRTIPEMGTDKEAVYYFNGNIFERAEEIIKTEAHEEYLRQWKEMLAISDDNGLNARLSNALNRGPSANDVNEALAMIRRTTFTYEEMNPPSHIPFRNGLLNLKTRKMEPFTSDLFYTYQVNASLLDKYVTLRDTPQFAYLLNTAYYEFDISTVLSYFAYSFYPDLPVHKILLVLGRERIGKGTSVRILQGLIEKGSGSISLARLLTSERFQFTGIEGKNLLIDSETKRKFRRGTVLEWSAFCNLFGKDTLSIEPKGHEAHDYVSKAKGIFLGNLPFIPVDSPPAISRILLVVTKGDRPKKIIPDLDKKILDNERDLIATLLIQILFKLVDRNFLFPGQLTDDSTAQLIEQLADPVENFIEEETEYDKEGTVQVDDAYSRFLEWCKNKGIPPIARQTFVKKFGRTYPKKRIGAHGRGGYVFTNCLLYESEVKVTEEEQKQVGTQLKLTETQKISLFREHYGRFQHEYTNLRVTREENHDSTCIEYSVQKLEPDGSLFKNRENKALVENELGSNLYKENDPIQDENKSKIHAKPSNSDVQSKKSEIYRYIVLKDFSIYGHTYLPGTEFEHATYFKDELKAGTLRLVPLQDALDRAKAEWLKNPRKFLFNFVEKEALETKFYSMTPKAIHDMLPVPDINLSTIYELCETLTKEGVFLKNKAGAYSVNAEFINGGTRNFFDKGDSK